MSNSGGVLVDTLASADECNKPQNGVASGNWYIFYKVTHMLTVIMAALTVTSSYYL